MALIFHWRQRCSTSAQSFYDHPIFWDATHARDVMRAYRDFLPTAPEELGAFVGLKTVPSMDPFPKDYWDRRACAVISSYNGPAEEGEKVCRRDQPSGAGAKSSASSTTAGWWRSRTAFSLARPS